MLAGVEVALDELNRRMNLLIAEIEHYMVEAQQKSMADPQSITCNTRGITFTYWASMRTIHFTTLSIV